jgi:hypothetical protein
MIDLPPGICYATWDLNGDFLTTCFKKLMVSGFGCQPRRRPKKKAGLIEKENLFLTGSTGWTG